VGCVEEPERGQLVPQVLVEVDRCGGVPGVQPHAGVQAGGAGRKRGGVGVAAGDLVGQDQLETVRVGQALLPCWRQPLGQGVQQLAELKRAQDLLEVGADRVGQRR
jgi:hypothetical protein